MCICLNDPATTEIYTLSLHDALPILAVRTRLPLRRAEQTFPRTAPSDRLYQAATRCCRSEEHTSELQSRLHLVCRLLLEKKNKICSTILELTALLTCVLKNILIDQAV